LDTGASPEALVEAVLTAAISRGARTVQTALPFLSSLPLSVHTHSSPNNIPALDYFTGEFQQLPLWVRELDAFAPAALAAYATLRQHILTDGAASRKTKELLTMLLNALSANVGGIRSHANGAKRMGASRDEIYSVLLLGIPIGGIIVWINGVNALAESPGIFP
jgi:alkylhydroperoxidase/carboxymuconolactone decarboxylase family protein YurZ